MFGTILRIEVTSSITIRLFKSAARFERLVPELSNKLLKTHSGSYLLQNISFSLHSNDFLYGAAWTLEFNNSFLFQLI